MRMTGCEQSARAHTHIHTHADIVKDSNTGHKRKSAQMYSKK